MRDYKNPTSLLSEGFDDVGTPDMKYYAFDWDDNILQMPTEIVVTNDKGDEIGMSTEDFAEYRVQIGKEPFNYKGETIVGYAPDAFRNFTTKGDKQFLIDAMKAKPGPAWADFVEAVNNGSIFSANNLLILKGQKSSCRITATKSYHKVAESSIPK